MLQVRKRARVYGKTSFIAARVKVLDKAGIKNVYAFSSCTLPDSFAAPIEADTPQGRRRRTEE